LPVPVTGHNTWDVTIMPYMKNTQILVCPDNKSTRIRRRLPSGPKRGYAIARYMAGMDQDACPIPLARSSSSRRGPTPLAPCPTLLPSSVNSPDSIRTIRRLPTATMAATTLPTSTAQSKLVSRAPPAPSPTMGREPRRANWNQHSLGDTVLWSFQDWPYLLQG